MRSFFFITSLVISYCLSATTYYIRLDGSDNNNGLANSADQAWENIDYALNKLNPGDSLLVNSGTYVTNGVYIEGLHGTQTSPIVIKSINLFEAKITRNESADPDRSVVEFKNSSYIIIDGFEIFGNTSGIESGVDIRDASHHITIQNCYVHDCACGGIVSRLSDYLTFESNVVRDNAKRNKWNCSGISIWHPVERDQEPGYHIQIKRNITFENECNIPFTPLGFNRPTDGNGIIIDDFRNTQGGGQEGGYKSAVLVENNLTFNNGGRGINVYESDNVTIRNNTSYHNLRVLSKYNDYPGDVTVSNSRGSQVYNNIIVQNPEISTNALRCYDNDGKNTRIFSNLIIGSKDFCGQDLYDENNVVMDSTAQQYVKFKAPSVDISSVNPEDFRTLFGLCKKSPAIDTGIDENAPEVDRDLVKRPMKRKVDLGCYEWTKNR